MCICVSGSRVIWGDDFRFEMLWHAGVHVYGVRHGGGVIGKLGSVVSGSVGVGPGVEVPVMLPYPPVRQASVSVSKIWGIIRLCNVRWFCLCMCICGYIAVCLSRWAWVCGFLRITTVLKSVFPSVRCCVSVGGAGSTLVT